MARIALIGPGAIGSTLAAWLASTGRHEVVLCARSALADLRVETPSGTLTAQPRVVTRPADAGHADWILVATKAYDAAAAAAWFEALGTNAPIAILQNGVEHVARFAPYARTERILPVVVDVPAERTAPGRVRQRGPGRLTVPAGTHGSSFAALFAGTALEVIVTPDFTSAAWQKLCLNAAGVVSALTLKPAGIMRRDDVAELAAGLIREGLAVGRAEGAVLDDSLVEKIVQRYRDGPPDAVNSLHGDRLAGRPTEIDARNGVIVRLGRAHGIPTPYNAMAVTLLQAMTSPSS